MFHYFLKLSIKKKFVIFFVLQMTVLPLISLLLIKLTSESKIMKKSDVFKLIFFVFFSLSSPIFCYSYFFEELFKGRWNNFTYALGFLILYFAIYIFIYAVIYIFFVLKKERKSYKLKFSLFLLILIPLLILFGALLYLNVHILMFILSPSMA